MTCENHFSNEDLGAAPIPNRGRAVLMNVKGQKRKEKKNISLAIRVGNSPG